MHYGYEFRIPQKSRCPRVNEALAILTVRNPLSVLSASYWENRKPWYVPSRRIGDHFCLFVESGCVRMETERGTRNLSAGEWCLLKIGELHAFGLAEGCSLCSHVIVHASPAYSPLRDPAELLRTPFFHFPPEECVRMRRMIGFCEWNREGGHGYFSAFLNAKLLELVPDSENWIPIPEEIRNAHVAAMCRFAELNFRSRIAVKDLAAAAGIGEAQCRRLFLSCLHCTPSEYLMNQRIFSAARELREGRKSIKEIALEYAFASPSHFCAVFRRKMKRTPEEYRNLP